MAAEYDLKKSGSSDASNAAGTTDSDKVDPMKYRGRPGRKWKLPTPSNISNKKMWTLMALGSLVFAIMFVAVSELLMPTVDNDGPVALQKAFADPKNNISIRAPLNWSLKDPHDGANIHIFGPNETGFFPLISMSTEVAAGKLEDYVKEQKDRIKAKDKKVVWIEEEGDPFEVINGCRAYRLVYDVVLESENEKNEDGTPKMVNVRSLQYIMDRNPRFHRVTCSVRADLYKKYLTRFEACAHSFELLPIPQLDIKDIRVDVAVPPTTISPEVKDAKESKTPPVAPVPAESDKPK
jgi:hypothetical protein